MSGFRTVAGFEEVWRPPVRPNRRRPQTVLPPPGAGAGVRARLARVARRAPEVLVKVTGRTRDPAHLAAHLAYVTRQGALAAETRDGPVMGRGEVAELAADWTLAALSDSRRRAGSPFSVGLILSMPAGTDAIRLRDAARAFAAETFAPRFDYLLALHTDTPHPHAHLTVRALAEDGGRLNPKKADLEGWRQGFAQALRDHGIEAEATPRRARGVTRKAERLGLRKLRERFEAGRGPMARTQRSAYREAVGLALGQAAAPSVWEAKILRRQRQVRGLYLTQARWLQQSDDAQDRALGAAVEAFVRDMPAPDTQRLALARRLRAVRAPVRSAERPRAR